MEALLVNISPAQAAKVYSGASNLVPVQQVPDLAGQQDVTVYICENNKITGSAKYVTAKVSNSAFDGSAVDTYGLHVAWQLKDSQKFDSAYALQDFKLKRAPAEWCHVKSL